MGDFSTIQARVRELILDLTTGVFQRVGPEILLAQRLLEDAHGFLCMEAEHEFSTAEGVRTGYVAPADYARSRTDARPYRVSGTGATTEIEWITRYGDRNRLYSDDPLDKGVPKHIYEHEDGFSVFPYPDALAPAGSYYADGNWRIRIPYFKRLPTLSAPTSTNWFTDHAEDYLVYQAASMGLLYNRDHEEAMRIGAVAEHHKQQVISQDKKRRTAKQRLLRPIRGARGSAFSSRRLR